MKRADYLLGAAIITAAALLWFAEKTAPAEPLITVRVAGKTVLQRAVRDLPERFEIDTGSGRITIGKNETGIFVAKACCPDRLCQKRGVIGKNGESIVCVPSETIISLSEAGQTEDYDAVIY